MRRRLLTLLVSLTSLGIIAAPTVTLVQAQSIADNVCKGILATESGQVNQTTTASSCAQSGDRTLGNMIERVINIFSIVVGSVSVIMIIIGGFRYIISGGDSTAVTAAKNTILYAIVGLVIVLFSQIIVRFVLTNLAPK